MQAATAGRLRVLQALLEHGADVHATTPDPPPPALHAVRTKHHHYKRLHCIAKSCNCAAKRCVMCMCICNLALAHAFERC